MKYNKNSIAYNNKFEIIVYIHHYISTPASVCVNTKTKNAPHSQSKMKFLLALVMI